MHAADFGPRNILPEFNYLCTMVYLIFIVNFNCKPFISDLLVWVKSFFSDLVILKWREKNLGKQTGQRPK